MTLEKVLSTVLAVASLYLAMMTFLPASAAALFM
jgi:hypothetical protein